MIRKRRNWWEELTRSQDRDKLFRWNLHKLELFRWKDLTKIENYRDSMQIGVVFAHKSFVLRLHFQPLYNHPSYKHCGWCESWETLLVTSIEYITAPIMSRVWTISDAYGSGAWQYCKTILYYKQQKKTNAGAWLYKTRNLCWYFILFFILNKSDP